MIYESTPATTRRWATGGDARALSVLGVILAVVAWNRLSFDVWLARYDVATYYLPWYAEIGERIRDLDVPAWNPHQFSGTPLAADPQSGWGYLIVMAAFALLPPLPAYEAMVVAQLVVAALSTYWLARTLRLGPAASLVAAAAYATGPFLEWDTACCLPFAQLSAWLPLALVGVELALRTDDWGERTAPLVVAALAVSQMLAGWVGEGWIYTVLVVGLWAGYRALFRGDGGLRRPVRRLLDGVVVGSAALVGGAALGAAGVLPRLAHNPETNLAGGDYQRFGARGVGNEPWDVGYLAAQLTGMGLGYHQRAVGLGGAVLVLGLIGLVLGWRRAATPFFGVLTTVVLVLTLDWTPVHWLVYRIPRYEVIHEHDPWRVLALLAIGPAMLAGTGVEALGAVRLRPAARPLLLMPVGLVLLVALTSGDLDGVIGWSSLAAAGVATAVAIGWVARRRSSSGAQETVRGYGVAPAVFLALVVAQPFGLEVTGAELGWPGDPRWERTWNPDPALAPALAAEVASSDPGGVGAFLTARLAEDGPFRFVGYAGVGYPDGGAGGRTYMIRRFEPGVQAVLVNGRPIFLGLLDVQGYNPIQLRRYVELFQAINGQEQGYHTAFVLASGVASPLLALLDIRYLVVDLALPQGRDDVVALGAGRREVFRSDRAIVYETAPRLGHAWIVHDVRPSERGPALTAMTQPGIDLATTAFVEGSPPEAAMPTNPEAERAVVIAPTPESTTIQVTATAPGLLVVSRPYADGWEATVDGEPVDILATDHALQGIPIAAGEHVVELRYRPLALSAGLWISAATMALAVAALCWRATVRSRTSPGRVSAGEPAE